MIKSGNRLVWVTLTLLAVFAAGCGGGGGGGGSSVLSVVRFEADGTDGVVFRDQAIVFEFSANLDPDSVSVTGLQVTQNNEIVPGRIEVEGRIIRWSPVILPGDRNDYNPNNFPPVNGLGFEGNARYVVRMLGNSPFGIQSKQGRPLASEFVGSFITSTAFTPEDPIIPPELLGDPIFRPSPLVDGDPFSENPDDWPIFDPTELLIELNMSERISPNSIDPFTSVTVRNITDVGGGVGGDVPAGVGEIAMMDTKLALQANRIDIRNIVSFGDWPQSDQPYEFRVELSRGVTDLAGNSLAAPIVFHFRTADRPGEPNYRVITEFFDSDELRDPVQTSANWGGGILDGADVNARSDTYVPTPQARFNLPHPLVEPGNPITPLGCRFQMRFDTGHVPSLPGESITGMSWSPRSGFSFFSVYREVTFKLGHSALPNAGHMDQEFDRNYSPLPQVMFQGDYTVPFSLDAEWIDWPTFDADFEYNKKSPLIFEYNMPEGGDTFQLFRNRSNGNFQTYRQFSNGDADRRRTANENTQYNTRFFFVSKRSIAQSIPIDTETGGADFGGALVVFDRDRPGTRIETSWGPSFGGGPPTEFVDDIDRADSATHLVFRVDLQANAFTALVPRVFSVSFAFVVPDEL